MAESQLGKVLTRQVGPLPLWGWIGVVGVGVGIGYFVIQRGRSGSKAQAGTPTPITTDVTGANAATTPQYSGPDTGTQNNNPVLTVPTPTGSAPILPVGYIPIKDGNGNIIGWEPPPPPSTDQKPPNVGTTFTGPTGVKHYVATGNETLSQIAAKFGLAGSWNSIYAIPANQALFGKLNYNQARTYIPVSGQTITLPP